MEVENRMHKWPFLHFLYYNNPMAPWMHLVTGHFSKYDRSCTAGLPDGLFSNKKSKFGYILECLGGKMVLYFITTWNILRPFGIMYCRLVYVVCCHLVFFAILICLDQEKSVNPDVQRYSLKWHLNPRSSAQMSLELPS
jgi:hypothetical protein